MRAYERLIKYAKVWTTSDEAHEDRSPSTERQFDLARILVEDMKELGIEDASVDENCYVTGHIPATPGYEDRVRLGFIAHMDTAPDASGEHVRPQVHENYDGGPLALAPAETETGTAEAKTGAAEVGAAEAEPETAETRTAEANTETAGEEPCAAEAGADCAGNGQAKETGAAAFRILDPAQFPELKDMKGKTLITSDGTTLLGADDKAGISEILTMVQELRDRKIPHGPLSVAFTPDEEIGSGAHLLDLDRFGAELAYTVDGGPTSEITYETFNAASAKFEITGVSVHPGSGKGIMVNAALVACEINSMLPAGDIPALTEGYEGFFHLTGMEGNVEKAAISYIVRDHRAANFQARQDLLRHIEKVLNEKYGEGTVSLTIRHQYSNMEEKIRPHMDLVETAKEAIRSLGIEPDTSPVRGGTDGAELSFRGLPCPNLGTGGYGFHGPYEHITAEDMDDEVKILTGIVRTYAEK